MQKILLTVFALLVLTATGCIKEPEEIIGCTDPDALTYNPSATVSNDASCRYLAQAYEGNYLAIESVTEYDNLSGDSSVSIRDYTFRILVDRLPEDVFVLGFNNCTDTLNGSTSSTALTIIDGSVCDFQNAVLNYNAGDLTYDYSYNAGSFSYRIRGDAISN